MADRYTKHIPSGQVFIYAPPWIGHEDFVEVANPAGDPLPDPEAIVNPAPARRKKNADAPVDDAALSADASRGLAAQGL
jgi:hypothetical protein